MWWQAVAAAAPSVMGAIGNALSSGDRDSAMALYEQALQQIAGIELPDIEKMKLDLDQFELAGQLDPQYQALFELGPSAFESINLDPRLRGTQMDALDEYVRKASGEFDQGDLAGFELAKREAAAYDQAKQAQLAQEFAQRGQAGSGTELITRLKGAQSAADRLAQSDLQQAVALQQAKMQALEGQANLAGRIQQQDYGMASDKAQSADAISRFNTQSRQQQNQANVNIANAAQAGNLAAKQQMMDSNVGLRNQQQQYNKRLLQQDFDNRMAKAKALAGQQSELAKQKEQRGAQTAGMYSTIGQGIGGAFASFNASKQREEDKLSKERDQRNYEDYLNILRNR